MPRPNELRLLVAVVGIAALLAGGCQNDSDSEAPEGSPSPSALPEGPIVIGAPVAASGYLAPYDYVLEGVKVLVAEVNDAGGVLGREIKIVEADTRSDPQQATVAVQQVLDEGAQVLLLTCESDSAAAEAFAAQEQGSFLNFSLCANEPGFGPPTTSRLSFSANSSLLSEVSAEATFFNDMGIENPFLFRDTSITYGKAACSGFEQAWENLGGSIAGQEDFKNADESVAVQVSALQGSDADAVVMCSYPPGGASAIRQIRAAGIDVPIIGPSAFEGTFWLEAVPSADLENVYVTQVGSSYDDPRAEVEAIFQKLRDAGVEVDVGGLQLAAYSAAEAIFDAIEATGSLDGNVLADELETWRDHPLSIGPTTYDPENHFGVRPWQVYELVNAEPTYVTTVPIDFIPIYEP